MLIAALLLLVLAVLLVLVAVLGGGDATSLDMGPVVLDASATVVFLLGMVTMALIAMAVLLLRTSGRRAATRRRERRQLSDLTERVERYENDRTPPASDPAG